MITCISPINRMYLDPIEYYEPDMTHVFIGTRDDAVSSLERSVYESSKKDIACKKIVEHRIDTSDYEEVLGEIIEIKKALQQEYGDDLDIYINISSGTPEFSAAGMFASMLPQPAIAFKVDADTRLSDDELSDIIGRFSGSIELSEPERVTGLRNDQPEEEMITFLTVVNDLLRKTRYPKYRTIIDALKDAGEWSYDPDRKSGAGRTTLEEKEERYLKRHYFAIALENGWLEKPNHSTMRLTDSGKAYISVYGEESRRNMCCKSAARPVTEDGAPMDAMAPMFEKATMNFEEPESNTVTFGHKKKYSFTIEMDQHR
jgi:hypothetical protein